MIVRIRYKIRVKFKDVEVKVDVSLNDKTYDMILTGFWVDDCFNIPQSNDERLHYVLPKNIISVDAI